MSTSTRWRRGWACSMFSRAVCARRTTGCGSPRSSIDGRTNGHVWAERYDRKFEDIFDLQDDISRSIVSALRVRMLPKELETITQKPTANTEAYRYYLMGRGFFHRGHTKRYLRLAKQMFARALDIDPDYAAAHAGIADCNSHLLDAGDTTITVQEILEQSERALSLDPTLAEAHASKGLALYTAGRYDEAEASFSSAIALKPDLFEAYLFYGRNCFNRGNYAKAAELFGKAAEFKNDDFRALGLQSMCFQSLGAATTRWSRRRGVRWRGPRQPLPNGPTMPMRWLSAPGFWRCSARPSAPRTGPSAPSSSSRTISIMHYNLACAFRHAWREGSGDGPAGKHLMGPNSLKSLKEFMLNDSDLDVLRDHPRYLALLQTAAGLNDAGGMTRVPSAAADLLLDNWAATTRIAALPEGCRPVTPRRWL